MSPYFHSFWTASCSVFISVIYRYAWEAIPSYWNFSFSCWKLAPIFLLFFPLFFYLSLGLWLLSLGFARYSSLDLRRLPQNRLHLGQKSQTSFKLSLLFGFLTKPIEQMLLSAVEQVREHCRKELFGGSSALAFSPKTENTEIVEGKVFSFYFRTVWSICLRLWRR